VTEASIRAKSTDCRFAPGSCVIDSTLLGVFAGPIGLYPVLQSTASRRGMVEFQLLSHSKSDIMPPVKYQEIIADKFSAAGWSWGYCSAVTRDGWRRIVDVHSGDGRRYIVQSDELLSALLESEPTLRECRKPRSPIRLRPSLQLHSFKPGICP
jgi:hypothetical protein